MLMHLDEAKTFRAASRRPYGAPAAGSSVRSKKRHQEVIDLFLIKQKIINIKNNIQTKIIER